MSADGTEGSREIQDVANGRGAKRIDGLGVVADDGQPSAAGLQREEDRRLKPVGVLIFIDENMVEPTANVVREHRIARRIWAQ